LAKHFADLFKFSSSSIDPARGPEKQSVGSGLRAVRTIAANMTATSHWPYAARRIKRAREIAAQARCTKELAKLFKMSYL
jgi:hypothetical protein